MPEATAFDILLQNATGEVGSDCSAVSALPSCNIGEDKIPPSKYGHSDL